MNKTMCFITVMIRMCIALLFMSFIVVITHVRNYCCCYYCFIFMSYTYCFIS